MEGEPKQLQRPERWEINCRMGDGLEVTLFHEPATNTQYVQVVDTKQYDHFTVQVPTPDMCDEVFTHPYAWRGWDQQKAA